MFGCFCKRVFEVKILPILSMKHNYELGYVTILLYYSYILCTAYKCSVCNAWNIHITLHLAHCSALKTIHFQSNKSTRMQYQPFLLSSKNWWKTELKVNNNVFLVSDDSTWHAKLSMLITSCDNNVSSLWLKMLIMLHIVCCFMQYYLKYTYIMQHSSTQ